MSVSSRLLCLFAALLAWGAIPPARAAEQQPELTRELELRLAADICVAAWEESAATDYYARSNLLVPLAAADPKRAQACVDAAPADQQGALRGYILKGMGGPGAELSAADALGQAKADPWSLLETARRVAMHDKAGATALLNRAVDALHHEKVTWTVANSLGRAAEVARELGDPRLPELVAEVERMGPEVLRQTTAANAPGKEYDWWGGYRCVAEALAAADPDAGLRLVEKVPDASHRERILLDVVARGVLKVDPLRTLALLDDHRPKPDRDSNGTTYQWSHVGRKIALALAKNDRASAEALARRLPRGEDRAEALATLALGSTPEHAAALRGEALDATAAIEPYRVTETLVRLAELWPVGPGRADICALALEKSVTAEPSGRSPYLLSRVAFIIAPVDPGGAGALLEDALAGCGQEEGAARQRKSVAMALAAIDPARAVEIAKSIPMADHSSRFDALRKIAQYLVATPEARASIHFGRWAAYDTWMPGEETEW